MKRSLFCFLLLLALSIVSCSDPFDEDWDDQVENDDVVVTGVLPGTFSVSSTLKVQFSQGNLQYQASNNIWRFAENQWDYVGTRIPDEDGWTGGNVSDCDNSLISSTYSGWIDLFGWGTSGYDHGGKCYQPWSTSSFASDYYAYGSYTNNLSDETGRADWGYNAISNGGNQENIGWRTMMAEEWEYLLFERATTSGVRFAKGVVNTVAGLIILPDSWDVSYFDFANGNDVHASFSSNIIDMAQWETMEQYGAVFLPSAGYRHENRVDCAGHEGAYWTSSSDDDDDALYVSFYYAGHNDSNVEIDNHFNRSYGKSVRLVHIAQSGDNVEDDNIHVVTLKPYNITQTTAVCGGELVDGSVQSFSQLGVCWNKLPNPTISGSHQEATTDETGSFTVSVTGLTPGTTYHVRAYAKNSAGTSYGDDQTFTTLSVEDGVPQGAISGRFSVSATEQVYFSQGNLQYKASTNTWRFAEHQWDYVGAQTPVYGNPCGTVPQSDNSNISQNYNGWIDLFGWGTSGYNHGANCYQPWSTSTSSADYCVYGSSSYHLFNQTGKADWGYNAISNGGNHENSGWRTPTHEEWVYVFKTRYTPSGIRYAKAKVNDVNGVILLPDNWNSSYYSLSNTNQSDASYNSKTITASQWSTLEQHGAVFLPAAGGRYGTSVGNVGSSHGFYWSASCYDANDAWRVYFNDSGVYTDSDDCRYYGRSVRLVRSAQ